MSNFQKKLIAYGYTAETVSAKVKQRIKEYNNKLTEQNEYKETLGLLLAEQKDPDLKPARVKKLPAEIQIMEENIADIGKDIEALDTKITNDLERLNKNGYGKGGKYDTMSRGLKSRKSAPPKPEPVAAVEMGAVVDTPPAQTPPEPPAPAAKVPEPAKVVSIKTSTPEPNPKRTQPPAPPAPASKSEPAKKKDNTILVVGGILLAAVLGFFGYRYWKNNQS